MDDCRIYDCDRSHMGLWNSATMNVWSTTNCWYQSWRQHVKNIHRFPERREGYQHAALIAQAYYVMSLATESWKETSHGND